MKHKKRKEKLQQRISGYQATLRHLQVNSSSLYPAGFHCPGSNKK